MSKTTRQPKLTFEYWAQLDAEAAARHTEYDAWYATQPIPAETQELFDTFDANVAACNAAAPGEWVRTGPSGAFRQAGHAAPTASQVPAIVGHEYEVAGDGAIWHEGRLLTGVWLSPEGVAWAGRIRSDNAGSWVDLATDDQAEGTLVPASQNWGACIVRELPLVSPISNSQAA